MEKNSKIFISYSWSSEEHVEKVVSLATRLMNNGVLVILDKWDLKEGHDKYKFMEQCVTDKDVDKVLLICDKVYSEKADGRAGGVGDETAIITPEIYGKQQQEKFVPIIFERNEENEAYMPAYLKARMYFDLSSEEEYEETYEKLLRNILNKPLYKKPKLGTIPVWIEDEEVDFFTLRDTLRQMKHNGGKNKKKFAVQKSSFVAEFIGTAKMYAISEKPTGDLIVKVIEKLKPLRDFFIEYIEILNTSENDDINELPDIFEQLYNELLIIEATSNYKSWLDGYKFLIWELFLATVAYLYHYKQYNVIYALTHHTYFLRSHHFVSAELLPESFVIFRPYLSSIEEGYEDGSGQKYLSVTSKILVERENKPLITQNSISFADILLSQLSNYTWYPSSYIYNMNAQNEWVKLKSKNIAKRFFRFLE